MSEGLTLSSPVADVDARIATRRMGLHSKGPPAHRVLDDAMGIVTVEDLLRHYPRRTIDRTECKPIRELRIGEEVNVIGRVTRVEKRPTRRRQTMVTVSLYDGTGYLDLTFFNQPWLAAMYSKGTELAASGRVQRYQRRLQLANQEVEVLRGEESDTVHTGRIIPVYRASEGISGRTIRELVHRALQRLGPITDPLPAAIVSGEGLASEDEALRGIHFPPDPRAMGRARARLKFDELFVLELGVAYRKRRIEREATGMAHRVDGPLTRGFVEGLPFEPTGAQRRAIKEIGEDLAASRPMNRLLQGDVGSGKTVVALHAAMAAVQSGHQATIMAPTEVLAAQHYRSVAALSASVGGRDALGDAGDGQLDLLDQPDAAPGLTFAILTASVTGKDRQRVVQGIADGSIDLVVGTHALVQEGIEFADLSLAVIDEQHRFGVHQRISLKEKGARGGAQPDVLIMTATPIPRTLALTYYGDLDVSVLDEMPAGRRPVTTTIARTQGERAGAYRLVHDEVTAGRQAFVVCAAIDEGNRLEVRAAEAEAERLRKEVFPDLRLSLLHGRLRPAEKEAAMEAFRAGQADVLIATTVIEVGVDVPNATVMLVENAERFGLSQLHQMRGRIGRGDNPSHCVLFDESRGNEEAQARLVVLARTTDGFELADEDLRLRGEGTLFDVRQSGMPDLKLAKLARDADLVRRARTRAFGVIDDDPHLDRHPQLLEFLRGSFRGGAIEWLFHS